MLSRKTNRRIHMLGVSLLLVAQLHVLLVAELHRHASDFALGSSRSSSVQQTHQPRLTINARNPICEICWIARHGGGVSVETAGAPLVLPAVESLVQLHFANYSFSSYLSHSGRDPPQC